MINGTNKRINRILVDSVRTLYPVEEVWTQSSIAAQPLIRAFVTFLNNVASDHTPTIACGCFPGQGDGCLDLVTVVQVQRWTWPLCRGSTIEFSVFYFLTKDAHCPAHAQDGELTQTESNSSLETYWFNLFTLWCTVRRLLIFW